MERLDTEITQFKQENLGRLPEQLQIQPAGDERAGDQSAVVNERSIGDCPGQDGARKRSCRVYKAIELAIEASQPEQDGGRQQQ